MIEIPVTTVDECGLIADAEAVSGPARPRRSAADRSHSGRSKTVVERDRRRPPGRVPNSRQSRCLTTSSHSQGRERAMSDPQSTPLVTYVGIDVAKSSVEVCVRAQNRWFTPRDPSHLIQELAGVEARFVVLEATGG